MKIWGEADESTVWGRFLVKTQLECRNARKSGFHILTGATNNISKVMLTEYVPIFDTNK